MMQNIQKLKKEIKKIKQKITEDCIPDFSSSSLFDASCVHKIYNEISDEQIKSYLLIYLESGVINRNSFSYYVYAILNEDGFIGLSDVVENNTLTRTADKELQYKRK